MKLKVLLILMLAAVTFTSYAQDGGIRGKVVSRNGRVALSNVQVKIESLGLTAMTDKDGTSSSRIFLRAATRCSSLRPTSRTST